MRARTFVLAAALSCTACGGPTAPRVTEVPHGPVDRVDILAAQPPQGATLTRGASVTFSYTCSYELVNGDNGFVVMVMQDQLGRPLIARDHPQSRVAKGTGIAELTHTIDVPSTSDVTAVDVFLAIFIGTQRSSSHMAMMRYEIK